MSSIEGSYIGLSRYILEHPFDFGWIKLWYCGIPFQNSYPPLLHQAVAAVAWLSGVSPALAHHAVTAALYCLGPVTLFLFAFGLSGKRGSSFTAAAIYSLISPSVFMAGSIRAWAGPVWSPARLRSLVEYGDGPHVSALALMPLALLALDWACRKGGPGRIYLAAAVVSSVVLTNWVGAFGLAMAAFSYLLARFGGPGWVRPTVVAAAIGVIAYALAGPWLPPSTVGRISHNSQHVIGDYTIGAGRLGYAFLLLLAVAGLHFAFQRWRASPVLRFGCYFFLFTGAIVLMDSWFGIPLMPRPHRYHLEMEMAICLIAAFILVPLSSRLSFRYKAVLFAAAVIMALVQLGNYRQIAGWMIQPGDITATFEYRASTWFRKNLPNARVFNTGSIQFWLNAFADTPQVGGGFAPGIVNPQIPVVHFGIPWTTGDGQATAMWLRLYGAQAVTVSGPLGRDAYKEAWRDAKKFEGVLPELWRDGDDVIYSVPQRSGSLAHVILPEHVAQRSPLHNADFDPVRPLAGALEDPALPLATFAWEGSSQARINARLSPGQLLFVQVSYHPGWRAFAGGELRSIRREALGFMIVEPRCAGDCEITLRYDGGREMVFARSALEIALMGGFIWFLATLRKRT